MLSIGKLSYLAQLSQSGVQPVETVLDGELLLEDNTCYLINPTQPSTMALI